LDDLFASDCDALGCCTGRELDTLFWHGSNRESDIHRLGRRKVTGSVSKVLGQDMLHSLETLNEVGFPQFAVMTGVVVNDCVVSGAASSHLGRLCLVLLS